MKKYLDIIVYGFFAIFVIGAILIGQSMRKENRRLAGNMSALMTENKELTTENGKLMIENKTLVLTKGELEEYRRDLVAQVKDMGVRLRRLQSISNTVIETDIDAKVPLRDTLILRDTIIKVQKFTWSDAYTNMTGLIEKDSVDISYYSIDSLTQVAYVIPKRFLGIIPYGVKEIRQRITNANPRTKIVFQENIAIVK